MRTIKPAALLFACGAALLFACGAALLAQPQDVFFTAAAPPGMPGMAGPQTFAFVAGGLGGGNPVKGAPHSGEAGTDTTPTPAGGHRTVSPATAPVFPRGPGAAAREH